MRLFHPEYGHTELQLKQMRSHVRIMLNVFDQYDLKITEAEEEALKEQVEAVQKTLESLIQYTEREIEVDYLDRKFESSD
jgi:hypothetical protein